IASIASVAGGGCAFALLLRNVGAKQIVAVVALPLSIGLIISGSLVEAGIFAVPTFDSFDYVISTIPEDRIDEAYYDEDLDAIVFDGIEYPPEKVPNPNLLEGPKRIAGIAYELLNPFAGNCIDMVRQFDDEVSIPVWIYPIYLLKAFVWMLLSSLGRGRNAGDGANGAREEPEPRTEREEHIGRHFAPRA
ncbi:MAG: hypothetical protein IJH87_04455, partial [Atopobiaceae bacterium]|nr:hypothetical protein [Atopobiaceae bacterium]